MTELKSTMGAIQAVVGMRGPTTTLAVTDSKIQFVSLSAGRVAWFVCMQVFRMGISVALAIGGAQFLLKTTSVTELLLNVVALEFIMSLDEVPLNPVLAILKL